MIHVINDWYIDADPNCYIVGQLRKRKTKEGDTEDYLSNTKFPTTCRACHRRVHKNKDGKWLYSEKKKGCG